ncbi:MAG: hypothetical protein HFJ35_04770 [Clostridia bacterium]|nr:hypothetical protein [Clostridia bacterium]
MSRMKKNNTKKIIFGIILLIIMIVVIIMICNMRENNKNTEKESMYGTESITSRTFNVEGKEAKYTLLRNEDKTVYGIEFQNLELMTKITIIRVETDEEIKDSITNNIYRFTTDGICKLEIETIDGNRVTTALFKVIAKETTIE